MGEIMRWRFARRAQRRVPDPATTLNLLIHFRSSQLFGAQTLDQGHDSAGNRQLRKDTVESDDAATVREYIKCGRDTAERKADCERLQLVCWVNGTWIRSEQSRSSSVPSVQPADRGGTHLASEYPSLPAVAP